MKVDFFTACNANLVQICTKIASNRNKEVVWKFNESPNAKETTHYLPNLPHAANTNIIFTIEDLWDRKDSDALEDIILAAPTTTLSNSISSTQHSICEHIAAKSNIPSISNSFSILNKKRNPNYLLWVLVTKVK